ncbi:MAG: hypothetical protein PHT80_14505, partial [Lentisphaeria bacterium]|nr:hypothetical protein [Lentisphaeria bacterium]
MCNGWAATGRGFPAHCPQCSPLRGGYSYETDALHLTVSMALVVSTKQPFLVVHFRREAAEALKAR